MIYFFSMELILRKKYSCFLIGIRTITKSILFCCANWKIWFFIWLKWILPFPFHLNRPTWTHFAHFCLRFHFLTIFMIRTGERPFRTLAPASGYRIWKFHMFNSEPNWMTSSLHSNILKSYWNQRPLLTEEAGLDGRTDSLFSPLAAIFSHRSFFFLLLWRSEHWRRLIDADIAAAAPPSAARQTVRPGAPSSCHPLRFFHRRFSSPSSVSPLCLLSFSFRISFLFFGSFFFFLGATSWSLFQPLFRATRPRSSQWLGFNTRAISIYASLNQWLDSSNSMRYFHLLSDLCRAFTRFFMKISTIFFPQRLLLVNVFAYFCVWTGYIDGLELLFVLWKLFRLGITGFYWILYPTPRDSPYLDLLFHRNASCNLYFLLTFGG